jgi:DNA-binding PadR family transcriptional regulator
MRQKTTPYVILGFLAQQPALSGYEIRKLIALTVGHFWNESFGQLYPELRRLTKAGLITTAADAAAVRRRARYRLTSAGRRALTAWLAQPAKPERVRNELLLKTFFGHELAPERLRQHLTSAAERWRADAEGFALGQQQLGEDADDPRLVYYVATIRHGRWVRGARLRWALETLELLDIAAKRGNKGLIAHLKRIERSLP